MEWRLSRGLTIKHYPRHARRLYQIAGVPGSGKTTLALQFLMEGARLNEPVLYITLSESEEETREMAAAHLTNG